jgi:tellurite resistance protein
MSDELFEDRRKSLEEQFFAKENERLRQKLKTTFEKKATRESLQAASGITDERVLDVLLAMNVSHQTLAAFALFPLVEVAWADGSLDAKERAALLTAAEKDGLLPDTPGRVVLEEWLQHAPAEPGRAAWRAYVKELRAKLNASELEKVRNELLRRARSVAEASGGILGIGKISASEEKVLADIEATFS